MKQEQFQQSWYQLKGPLKNHWGKLTDEDIALIAGDQSKFHVAVETRYGDMGQEVGKWADRWYAKWTGQYIGYEEVKVAGPAATEDLSN
jgi:uncharacterized protein YjbJ (UPF0337 family)